MLFSEDRIVRSARGASLAVSLGIHCVVFGILWWLPPFPDTDFDSETRRTQQLLTKAHKEPAKIFWFQRNEKLPVIAPSHAASTADKQRVDSNRLYIRVHPPGAQHKDQFIYVSEPKIPDQKALPSPNVVMTDLVAPPAPPKPEGRQFTPPVLQQPKSETARLEEPQVAARLDLQKTQQSSLPDSLKNAGKPAGKKFVAPEEKATQPASQVALAEPAGLPMAASSLNNPKLTVDNGLLNAGKPRGKKLVLPSSLEGGGSGGGGRTVSSASLEEPGVPTAGGQPGIPSDISAVIISANPPPDGRLIRPEGNRQARIDSGTSGGAGKGSGNGGGPADLVVPGLTVRGGGGTNAGGVSAARNTAAESAARPEMTPTRPPAYRPRLDTPSVSIPQWPNTRRVPAQVEGAFSGRPVYSTVIAAPAGYADWVLWFGEFPSDAPRTRSVMRPPRLDSSASPLASLRLPGPGKCWVKAKLSKGGKLVSLEISQGMGTDQVREFANVLEKCLWTPAIRNGEAVDVDVVLEVDLRRAN